MAYKTPLTGQRVLVTGAGGFLGTHICRRLYECGATLHAVSRSEPRDEALYASWTCADVSDFTKVDTLFQDLRPEIVFHLSGRGVGSPDPRNVLPTLRHDLTTAVNVLTAATQSGARRVVLAASLEEPVLGEPEMVPSSPYAAAKFSVTIYSQMFNKLYGTPVVQVRPFMTYGPGQRSHKLIPYVTLALLQGQVPKLGSGQRPVDWVYIDDVIDGMISAACAPDIEGCSIDLGSGALVSIREVVMQLVEIVGVPIQPEFGAITDRPLEKIRVADMTAPLEKLGWSPRISLRDGLERTVEWFRKELEHSAVEENSRGRK